MRAVPRVSRASLRSGFLAPYPHASPPSRTHANGSIKRGCKDNATDPVPLRTGIGVQLKDIKVFNRDRQKGEAGRRAGGPGRRGEQGQPGLGRRGNRREVGAFEERSRDSHELGGAGRKDGAAEQIWVLDPIPWLSGGPAEISGWDPQGTEAPQEPYTTVH